MAESLARDRKDDIPEEFLGMIDEITFHTLCMIRGVPGSDKLLEEATAGMCHRIPVEEADIYRLF